MTTFIVGTGRCGTLSAAYLAAAIPTVDWVRHEGWDQAIPLSYVAHKQAMNAGAIAREVRSEWESPWAQGAWNRAAPDVEADFRLSMLIPWLAQLPGARFVWLVRNPWDTITSMKRAGWFEPDRDPTNPYVQYEIRPDTECTPHQARCWWWAYCNQTIAADLQRFRAPTLVVEADALTGETGRSMFRWFIDIEDVGPGPVLVSTHQRPRRTVGTEIEMAPREPLTPEERTEVDVTCRGLWEELRERLQGTC